MKHLIDLPVGTKFRFVRPSGLLSSIAWTVVKHQPNGRILCEDEEGYRMAYPAFRDVLIE